MNELGHNDIEKGCNDIEMDYNGIEILVIMSLDDNEMSFFR